MKKVLMVLGGEPLGGDEHNGAHCNGCELVVMDNRKFPGQHAHCPVYGELYADDRNEDVMGLTLRPEECKTDEVNGQEDAQ